MVRVDDVGVVGNRYLPFELSSRAGENNPAIDGGERAVSDGFKTALVGTSPRRRSGAGDELSAVAQNQHAWRFPVLRHWRWSAS